MGLQPHRDWRQLGQFSHDRHHERSERRCRRHHPRVDRRDGHGRGAAWGGNNFSTSATTEAAGIGANDFATFSVTAQPGYALSLSDIPAYNIRRSATGPSTGVWQYKVDGGAFTDIESSPITWGSVTTTAGNPESAISLTGIPALQNIPANTTVTFRCVNWGATNVAGTWYFNDPSNTTANDLVVEGTLNAVPEPSMLALLAAGGACTLASIVVRRRGRVSPM